MEQNVTFVCSEKSLPEQPHLHKPPKRRQCYSLIQSVFKFQLRYNFERLCNDMSRVTRLIDWREPIPEAYFPKLDNIIANRVWPSRPANATLKVTYFIWICELVSSVDKFIFVFLQYLLMHASCILQNVNRNVEQVAVDIEDLERWRDRIFNAIHSGYIVVNVII